MRKTGDERQVPLRLSGRPCPRCSGLRRRSWQATWEIPTGPEHQQAVLPGDGKQAELDQPGEQIIEGVTIQVVANGLADLAPRHAGVPGLGDQRHHDIGCGDMLPPLAIPLM